jgi:hypothetical protein
MKKKKGRRRATRQTDQVTQWWTSKLSLYAIVLLILSFVFYGNALRNGYTYDDKPFIAQNYIVQQGVSGIPPF